MVASTALWYTIGDPAASEGERFCAGLNALGRLLSVGGEWAGYATLMPTGGARKAARAAADEASEQLGRHGARQAARGAADQTFSRFMSKASFEPYKRLENYAAGVQEKLTSP